MRERSDDTNPTPLPLAGGYYGEWVWNSTATWTWGGQSPLEAGWCILCLSLATVSPLIEMESTLAAFAKVIFFVSENR